MEISDTLGFLLGTWHLERILEDHLGQVRGSFTGTATLQETALTPASVGMGARYVEEGELRLGRFAGPTHRSLDLVGVDEGRVMVYFLDGRPYVDLDLRGGRWESVHLCRDDRYQITTTVSSEASFEELWRVTGPKKDYTALTVLTRLSPRDQ